MPAHRWTITEIRRANAEAGFFFFAKDTMKFFASRIEALHQGSGGVFIVTSEKAYRDDQPRRYTVRQFHPETGNVTTTPAQDRKHLWHAKDDAKEYARHGLPTEEE